MTNEEVIEKLVELRHMHERRVFCAISDETDEALGMAIAALEQAPTALDHIHNVVAENERQRGYAQAKAEYDAKLEEVKSRFKGHYYNKGYKQGKAETNLPEIPDSWIPVTKKMPEDDGEYFVLYDEEYAENYDTGRVGVADFYVDCEAFGYWQQRYDPVSLGFVDCDFTEIKVKKWMPIPKEE